MTKLNFRLAFIPCLIVPTFSYAAIECSAVNFNLNPFPANRIIALDKEEQDYHTVFTGTQEGHKFKIVIAKSSMDVYGNIETAEKVTYDFRGAFSSDGRFEFTTMSGGNITIPEKLIAISCFKK